VSGDAATSTEENMTLPVRIEFRNLDASPVVQRWIGEAVAKLETFFDRIIGCRVLVEVPHLHRRRGSPYVVKIELSVPGREIVVQHQPSQGSSLRASGRAAKRFDVQAPHKNLRRAIDDAFRRAGRQLQDHARCVRH
jgi:ribosome-associated translation inhibitor RaiA